MKRTDKIVFYGALLLSVILFVLAVSSKVSAFPGAENFTSATVNDSRVDPTQVVTWTVTVLNNVTFWVNVTLTYNTTTHGPYNITLTPAGDAVIVDNAPTPQGNYTVYVTTVGAIQNVTYVGFIVDLYNIEVGALYTEVEAGFQSLIYANGSSVIDGHDLTDGDTLIINGVTLAWNSYMSRFEAIVTSAIPAIVTYDTLTSLIETTYTVTNGNITTAPTITWTTTKIEQITPFMRTGDWPGAIIEINLLLIGETMFWTFLLMTISMGVYNYSGPEVTLLVWMFGWGTFSTVIHSQAQTLGLIMMALGGGIYIAKFFLDRRTSV